MSSFCASSTTNSFCNWEPTHNIIAFAIEGAYRLRAQQGSTAAEIFAAAAEAFPLDTFTLEDIKSALNYGAKKGIFIRSCFTDTEFKFAYNRNMTTLNPANKTYGSRYVIYAQGTHNYATQSGPPSYGHSSGTISRGCCGGGEIPSPGGATE